MSICIMVFAVAVVDRITLLQRRHAIKSIKKALFTITGRITNSIGIQKKAVNTFPYSRAVSPWSVVKTAFFIVEIASICVAFLITYLIASLFIALVDDALLFLNIKRGWCRRCKLNYISNTTCKVWIKCFTSKTIVEWGTITFKITMTVMTVSMICAWI